MSFFIFIYHSWEIIIIHFLIQLSSNCTGFLKSYRVVHTHKHAMPCSWLFSMWMIVENYLHLIIWLEYVKNFKTQKNVCTTLSIEGRMNILKLLKEGMLLYVLCILYGGIALQVFQFVFNFSLTSLVHIEFIDSVLPFLNWFLAFEMPFYIYT